jgi:hypothetical protein
VANIVANASVPNDATERFVGNTDISVRNYWHGAPPKPLEGVEVNTGGVPWRFAQ